MFPGTFLAGRKELASGDLLAGDLFHVSGYRFLIMLHRGTVAVAEGVCRGSTVPVHNDLAYELPPLGEVHLFPDFLHRHFYRRLLKSGPSERPRTKD